MMTRNWTPKRRVTAEEIEAGKTPKGGWTHAQFREWGVPTPPPHGWKARLTTFGDPEPDPVAFNAAMDRMLAKAETQLIDGAPLGVEGQLDIDPAKLLRKVVSAVISAGHADCLYEFPDLLAFFGARMSRNDERGRGK